jgi:hypothetical protein
MTLDYDGPAGDGFGGRGIETDAQGRYNVADLPPGPGYRLLVNTGDNPYATFWYEHATTKQAATPLTMTAGVITTLNLALPLGGRIAGIITDTAPLPASTVLLDVYATGDSSRYIRGVGLTQPGPYVTGGLLAGTYKLGYRYPNQVVSDSLLFGETFGYWNLKPTFTQADVITITNGITTQVNLDFTVLSTISGRVSDQRTGAPIADFEVDAQAANGIRVALATTDATGVYHIAHLAPASYTIIFTGKLWPLSCGRICTGEPVYKEQRYPQAISVALKQTIAHIDHAAYRYMGFIPMVRR